MPTALRQTRLAKNISLGSLASETGVTSSYLSKIERGQAKPSPLILSKIEAALNTLGSSMHGNGNGNGSGIPLETVKNPKVDPRNRLNDLIGQEWIKETKSVWRQRGLGANHPHTKYEKLHPAPFSFQDVGRVIRFFTKAGMTVLDPFLGSGSTLKAAAIEKRHGLGIELSPKWAELARLRLDEEVPGYSNQQIWCMDIRSALPKIPDNSLDLIVTSPPYWAILNKKADHKVKAVRLAKGLESNYSADERDMGNIPSYDQFLKELSGVFERLSDKLRPGKYCVIVVSDFKHGTIFYPFHSDLYRRIDQKKLALQGITVLEQGHKALYPYGYPFAYVPNIHHQYLLILRRPSLIGRNGKNGGEIRASIGNSKLATIPADIQGAIDRFRRLSYRTGDMAGRNWGHQRHTMCSYPSKVKPGLASVLVREFTCDGTVVLDPFSGCGSIPFEAALQGRQAYGTDLNPLAAAITAAKIDPPSVTELERLLDRLEGHVKTNWSRMASSKMEPEIRKFFHAKTVKEILAARQFLRGQRNDGGRGRAKQFAFACLAHILHGNRPYALSRRSHNIIPIPPKGPTVYKSVMKSLREKCDRMLSLPLPDAFRSGKGMIAPADKLPLKDASVDAIITSPPFLGTTHFLRQNRLRTWLMGWDYEKQATMKGKFLEHQRGVDAYRPILKELSRTLKPRGLAIFHVGIVNTVSMADLLAPLFLDAGFRELGRVWEDARSLETHGRTDRGGTHTHGFVILQKP